MLGKHIKFHFLYFFLINIFFTNVNIAVSQEYLEQVIQRLNTIEQELREVQKRTYKGSNEIIITNEDSQNIPSASQNNENFSISDHESRIISLEDQVRNLTGKIEELAFSFKNLESLVQESIIAINNKLEQNNTHLKSLHARDSAINNPANDTTINANTVNLTPPNEDVYDSSENIENRIAPLTDSNLIDPENSPDEVNIIPDPNAGSNPTMQTLGTIDTNENDISPSMLEDSNDTLQTVEQENQINALEPVNPAVSYQTAYEMLSRADYESAEIAFKSFIGENPDNSLASNAYYWLGETYYVRKLYKQAARSFAIGFQKFPNGSKAPDQLLKLGMSLVSLGKNEDACATFAKLELEFPNAPPRISNRASQYFERAECS